MKRIYLDRSDCCIDKDTITIRKDTFHYIAKVLRMREGDVFAGFDGTGINYEIQITDSGKNVFRGIITGSKKNNGVEIPFDLQLFQSIPKGGKMDFIIREAAQLGVKKVVPIISERVIGRIPGERISVKTERWRKISRESSMVAGRTIITEVSGHMKFSEAIKISPETSLLFWEQSQTPLKEALKKLPEFKKNDTLRIFVGPEGGYSEEEIETAKNLGAITVSIGKRILKVETASVIAAALTIYELENRT